MRSVSQDPIQSRPWACARGCGRGAGEGRRTISSVVCMLAERRIWLRRLRLQNQRFDGIRAYRLGAKRQRVEPTGDPAACEIGVVAGTRLARFTARNCDAAAIPIGQIPDGAETLREPGLLEMNRVFIPGTRQPVAVQKAE